MIDEYPFYGKIERTILDDLGDVSTEYVYDGEMDAGLNTGVTGEVAQTSNYIISIPLIKDNQGNYILPKKNDTIELDMYGDKFSLKIDSYIISQLGGITIYATRGSW